MRKIPLTISDFSGGIWSKSSPTSVPANSLYDAQNVIFDDGAPISRRWGHSPWTTSNIASRPIRTIFPWDRASGTRVVLVSVRNGATNETWSINDGGEPSSAVITGATGFSTTYEQEFAASLDNVYVSNGVEATQRYDGSTMAASGVDGTTPGAPTVAVAALATGIPNGTYQYSVSFVYGIRGESLAGTQSGNVTTSAGNQQVDLTGIPTALTGNPTRRIYRRDTAATTNPRVFVGELLDNTTTILSDSNANLDNSRRARTTSATPPTCRYVAWHSGWNRMFYAWQSGDRSRWWYSELRTPDIVLTANTEYLSRDDGQEITGLVPFRGGLVMFKTRGTYILEGTGPGDWNMRTIDRRVGCSHARSIQPTPRGVIFAGQEGIWLFDGVGLKYLSEGIENDWKKILQAWSSEGRYTWTNQFDWIQSAQSSNVTPGVGLIAGTFGE